ncbi:MAG: sn-glycerol-3-phosphate ABC transporter ATP-binding protein UgpC [Pseudomonadota bacterium]
MAGLDLSGVTKTYPGGVMAVSGATFNVADGEFIVLVGPSGCGKSTLLRMIAGLETITEGDVSIDGTRVNDMEPGDRDIAMVFQNYALYPHMSVYDNMAYGLKNQGMPKDQIKQRIDQAAETLQLTEYLARKPRQLSGGQRQRVAMGRAIVRDPKVFLFDEPLSNLDAKLRTHMRSELKEMHRRLGATFIFVTHDQVEAMSLADRIVVLNGGKIEQIGAPMELYATPATEFVAGFIGTPPMNMISLDGSIGSLLKDAAPAGAHMAGLRPEAVGSSDPQTAEITGQVALSEVLGAETVLYADVSVRDGAGPNQRLALRHAGAGAPAEGDTIGIQINPTDLSWFDGNGQRIG